MADIMSKYRTGWTRWAGPDRAVLRLQFARSAQSLNKFGRLDRETSNHDPKREIDFDRDNQLNLEIVIATGHNPAGCARVPVELAAPRSVHRNISRVKSVSENWEKN
jgi:hypothetical protein